MSDQENKIKESIEEFFEKMTTKVSVSEIKVSAAKNDSADEEISAEGNRDIIDAEVQSEEPQILIGQQGQTLFEIQRLLRMVLSRKLQKNLYLNLDINGYKRKKIEYLKDLARETANQVFLSKEEKALSPMSSYERRVVHAELSQRTDVVTESQGDSFDRHIVIKPK